MVSKAKRNIDQPDMKHKYLTASNYRNKKKEVSVAEASFFNLKKSVFLCLSGRATQLKWIISTFCFFDSSMNRLKLAYIVF